MLNNRETATLIWLAIAVVAGVAILWRQSDGARSLRRVLTSMIKWKVLGVVGSTAAYLVLVVWAAWQVGLWSPELLAPTLIWGLPATYGLGFLALEATKEEHFFRSTVKQALGVVIIIELLVNIDTFPLWWEMIQLPGISLVVVLEALAKAREEFASLRFCLGWLTALIGSGLLVATLIRFATNWSEHDWPTVARSLGLGLWLPLSALPLVYFWSIAMLYGTLWIHLRFQSPDQQLPWWRTAGVLLAIRLRRRALLRLTHAGRRDLARTSDLRTTYATGRRLLGL